MRPTKLTPKFLDIADEILNKDINAVIFTDEELLLLINEKLVGKEQITSRTFQRWKAKSKKIDEEDMTEEDKRLDDIGEKFCRIIKKALLKQKNDLFEELRKDERQWQRWAWIIERKFDDWNIKHKQDVTSDGKALSISISKEVADKNEITPSTE